MGDETEHVLGGITNTSLLPAGIIRGKEQREMRLNAQLRSSGLIPTAATSPGRVSVLWSDLWVRELALPAG